MRLKIDLTCPIEITRTEVLSDDRGRCRGYVDVINVCDHPIRRVEGRAVWLAEDGRELAQADVVFDGMRLIAQGHAQLTVAGEIPAAEGIELRFDEVAFADFSRSWSADEAEVVEYEFSPEPPGPGRDRLRGVAGPDAVCYPQRMGVRWLCVCGRLNPSARDSCARCLRSRERVFAALRESAGQEWSGFDDRLRRRERLNARRNELHQRAERERRLKRERRVRIVVGALVALMSVGALLLVGILLGYIVL